MQINAKGDTVKITLTQHEGQTMRGAGYIAQRIASNLPASDTTERLKAAAKMMINVANEFTPEPKKKPESDVPAGVPVDNIDTDTEDIPL